MFITDELTPAETLAELLNLKGLKPGDTVRFRTLQHDRDLCPAFRERVATMLDAYKSHRTDVQDTQGPRDEGIDVHLYYNQEGTHRVGLQIKSYDEIEKWAKKRDPQFMVRLKGQIAAALSKVGVDDYYLLLCTDEVTHKRRIRMIASELTGYERVKIVLPRQALALFELGDDQVSALVTQLLCNRDSILRDARHAARNLKPDAAYIQLALMGMACEGQTHVDDETLLDLYNEWAELAGVEPELDRLSEIVWDLNGEGFCYDVSGDDTLSIEGFPSAWCALYFDQKHRLRGDPLSKLALLLDILPGTPRSSRRRRRPSSAIST